MGLNISHDAWQGSCHSFNLWRNKIAEVAGYQLETIETPLFTHKRPRLDWANIHGIIGEDLLGEWKQIPFRPDGTQDPLIILFAHQDCDGQIASKWLEPLAKRLEGLLPLLKNEDPFFNNHHDTTKQFIEGCRKAAKKKQALDFH